MRLYDPSNLFPPSDNVLIFLLSLLYSLIEKYSTKKRTLIRCDFAKLNFK